ARQEPSRARFAVGAAPRGFRGAGRLGMHPVEAVRLDPVECHRLADRHKQQRHPAPSPACQLTLHPPKPAAPIAPRSRMQRAIVSMSGALDVIAAICTGFSMPISIGPIVALPASSRSSLAERLADCSPGMISTLAGPDRRLNG